MKKNDFYSLTGVTTTAVSHTEKLVSIFGGFCAIAVILYISQLVLDQASSIIIVTSMGASAVLLFAAPHGPMSQPWPVLGGHMISALIGVTCAQLIGPDVFNSEINSHQVVAASMAVGLSVGAMHYLRCIHPPGGATALAAVLSGQQVYELGYQFLLTPVLLNVLIILVMAIVFNAFFSWRRYPAYWFKLSQKQPLEPDVNIRHEDFVYALSQIDSFIDINEHDLIKIYNLAIHKSQAAGIPEDMICVGSYYSNGEYGQKWSVRQVVDQSADRDGKVGQLIYKTVAGEGRRTSGYATREEFSSWAKYQVIRDEENWKRVDA